MLSPRKFSIKKKTYFMPAKLNENCEICILFEGDNIFLFREINDYYSKNRDFCVYNRWQL